MNIKGTKSEENLRKALAGESIARNKYTYYAMAARKNGDEEIARAFEEMAKNEMTHARFWFEQLYGKPTDTMSTLIQAAQGEYSEWHTMYPEFAQQAREEGLEELAVMFEHVANIERSHENRFMTMLAKLQNKDPATAPSAADPSKPVEKPRKKKIGYRCQFCGEIFEKREDVCPVCLAIGAFDEVEYYE